jgi:hypothetical protein
MNELVVIDPVSKIAVRLMNALPPLLGLSGRMKWKPPGSTPCTSQVWSPVKEVAVTPSNPALSWRQATESDVKGSTGIEVQS